ncbi:MAG: hypothetical protein AAF550_14330 [Myxococcota bacterium]
MFSELFHLLSGLQFSVCALATLGSYGVILSGCGEDSATPFVSASWRIRCPEDTFGCALDGDDREIEAFDGELGSTVRCSVTELASVDERSLEFFVSADDGDYALALSDARTGKTGGAVTNQSCSVSVVEGPNRYTGSCTGSEPIGVERPCRVDGISFDPSNADGPTVRVSILCRQMPNSASSSEQLLRDMTASGDASEAADTAVDVRLVNCLGP